MTESPEEEIRRLQAEFDRQERERANREEQQRIEEAQRRQQEDK